MIAIIQLGYVVFGIGNNLEEAYKDAQEWADDLPEIGELAKYVGYGQNYDGQIVYGPCSAELAARVKEWGGDVKFSFEDGEFIAIGN